MPRTLILVRKLDTGRKGILMKFVSWIGKMVLVTALISLLSIYTTYYVVNSFVEKALKQYNINLTGSGLNLKQLLGGLSKAGKANPNEGSSQAQLDGGEEETTVPVEGDTTDPFGQDAVEAWNQSSGNSQQGAEGRKDIVMSPEELQKKKDQMGDADKMEVFSILTTKLPQEEVQKISLFIENGITEQELEEVKTILAKYLKDNEYEKLLNILKK